MLTYNRWFGLAAPDISCQEMLLQMGENAVLLATANGHTHVVRQLLDAGASVEMEWMGINALDVAQTLGRESAQQTIRAYESHFAGHISECRGCSCVASW